MTAYEIAHKVPSRAEVNAMLVTAPIGIRRLSDRLTALEHPSGNMLVSHGPDGVLVVDCYSDAMQSLVDKAIRSFTTAPYRYAVPTHFHYDHAGGAALFAGGGAAVVGVPQTRHRMAAPHRAGHMGVEQEAYPAVALPTLTYGDALTLDLNGESVGLRSFVAHTDTDSVVHFAEADVIHTGDIFVNMEGVPTYPFVDTAAGASTLGVLAAVEHALTLCTTSTLVFPGHGPQTTSQHLAWYGDLLRTAHESVADRLAAGDPKPAIVAAATEILRSFPLENPLIEDWLFISDVVDSLQVADQLLPAR
ncbi:hypothetical protein GCM10029976_056240 [Kribbella albertanoniae]|uniref:MBL fold metallo-hydrolase n=1 Tax=Kribbella albertanoniae TaxID=1266829 RepID=A0A4V2XQ91_9ACTN|nr:MBL fold metallo-hydrolase [Kribbella albertanoniae]TDC24995.1 MBL fold metallo-hydrolase [Kribbella albertanoniae]